MDYREASVCFLKMSNSRGMAWGGSEDGGEEKGGPSSFVTSWHYYCLQTMELVPLPLCQRQNRKLQCLLLSLYPCGNPVKSLPPAQAESGSSLRVQLMLACHPFFVWLNWRLGESKDCSLRQFLADRSCGFVTWWITVFSRWLQRWVAAPPMGCFSVFPAEECVLVSGALWETGQEPSPLSWNSSLLLWHMVSSQLNLAC